MAEKGETLSYETAKVGMICTDGTSRLVIDSLEAEDKAIVGVWWDGSFAYMGDEVDVRSLVFTGEMREDAGPYGP